MLLLFGWSGSTRQRSLLELRNDKLIVNFDLFNRLLRLQDAFLDQDIEEGHLGANFVSHCRPLVVVGQHLDIGNCVIEPDVIALIPRKILTMGEMDVQVIEGRLVMEVRHDLASLHVELRLDSTQTLISDGFKEGEMLAGQVTNALQVALRGNSKTVERLNVTLVELVILLQEERIGLVDAQFELLLLVED